MPLQRQAKWDLGIALLGLLASSVLLQQLDGFEWLYQLSRQHEAWQLDELLLSMMLMPLVLSWFSYRRWQEAQQASAELQHQALFDPLTQLPNRTHFTQLLQDACNQDDGGNISVMLLDLDNFQALNRRYGAAFGDQLLLVISQRLWGCLDLCDQLARFGSDEFALISGHCDSQQRAINMAERILLMCRTPVHIDGVEVRLSASIGISSRSAELGQQQPEHLLRQANNAMHDAKLNGKDGYVCFNVDDSQCKQVQQQQRQRFKRALQHNELQLYLQPQVALGSGKVIGAEALLRWHHPQQGLRFPDSFLTATEQHPLAVELGEWVLEQGLQQLLRWQQQGIQLKLSVNITPYHLLQPDFLSRLQLLIARYPDAPRHRLQIEVVETNNLTDLRHAADTMRQCGLLGVKFALDDFGSGHSSLTYLRELPAQVLKIDRSFTRDIMEDYNDLVVVKAMIRLGYTYGLEVLAEGIETEAQQQKLHSLGCGYGQGYLYAKALPPQEFDAWLQTQP